MIQTLLNPNHVLTDCDNIENIDAQRMAAVLGKHLYGFKKGDERAVVKTLGLDANDDVCWSNTGVPGGGLPPSTPEDEGKVLVVGEDGQPEWADLPFGGDIAYSVDRATQASWDVDTLYASTQFYIADSGDNGGIDYYLDGQDRKAGYELLEGHVYQVNFNCEATCASTSNNVWEGCIYVTGAQDQNWYFQLDGSQSIDVSLTGSTIIHCSSDSVLYFNARLNGRNLSNLPTLTINKVSIVDLTAASSGGGGGGDVPQYRPGTGIDISGDVISIDPTETQEKLTAGVNIEIDSDNIISTDKTVVAAGNNVSVTSSYDGLTKTTTYTVNSQQGEQPVQSDWSVTDNQSLAFIKNKPDLSNFATQSDLAGKQDTLTPGANITIQNNVISANPQRQADWDQADSSAADYIRNKPTIPSGNQLVPAATSSDEDKVLTVDSNGEPQWETPQSVSQVQSDWTELDSSAASYIQNKPTLATVATSGSYNDLSDQPTIPSGNQLLPSATSADENKVLTVDANGDPEWSTAQSVTQVQSDWTQTNNQQVDYIRNKPTVKALIAGNGITITETSQGIVISLT